jgi:fatty acid desaturase
MTIRTLAHPLRWLLADPSVAAHVSRGAVGFAAIAVSFAAPWSAAWPALILLPLALVMLRGCPMCWLQNTVCSIQANRSTPTTETRDSDVHNRLR